MAQDVHDVVLLERATQPGEKNVMSKVLRLPSLRRYGQDPFPHTPYTVFCSKFDAWFAQEAESVGAEIVTEALVEDLTWADGRVAGVQTGRGDLWARVVLGADGVNSTVAAFGSLCAVYARRELHVAEGMVGI